MSDQKSTLRVGDLAPDFTLPDQSGRAVTLSEEVKSGPVLLAFYPGDFTPVCTKQLCSYANGADEFRRFGVKILGISHDDVESHSRFAREHQMPFKLLTDADQSVVRSFEATSSFMLGRPTRAVFLISTQRTILFKHIEKTVLTHRNAADLVGILDDLRKRQVI